VATTYGEYGSGIPLNRQGSLGSVVRSPSRGLIENDFDAHLGFGEHLWKQFSRKSVQK